MAAFTHTRSYLVGLIGAGIGGSLSPALHEHEAHCLGLDYAYRVLDIDELGVEPQRHRRAARARPARPGSTGSTSPIRASSSCSSTSTR